MLAASTGLVSAQPRRLLYLTHSAGFRHDSLPVSIEAMRAIAEASGGRLEVTATEDVGQLNAAALAGFDAVVFFTSGELPISDSQKQDLLAFVRNGKGFGGAHSATDTLYTWPEYGELIGARFNGHTWVQEVRIDVEDPAFPAVSHLAPSFSIVDEIYQFRDFSRSRDHVLLTLDTRSVDLSASGVNPGTEDFPLAWCRPYGSGRVFYTALGHFESTWRDDRFRRMLLEAMLWLTGQKDANAVPVPQAAPAFSSDGVANSASFDPRGAVSAGSLISIFGERLTGGAAIAADIQTPSYKLAGTTVKINGASVPLLYVSPGQINALVPLEAQAQPCSAGAAACQGSQFTIELSTAGGKSAPVPVRAAPVTPGVFTATTEPGYLAIWATGLGAVETSGGYFITTTTPRVSIAGAPVRVLFSGLAPGWPGLYQVNVERPASLPFPALVEFEFGGATQNLWINPQR